MINVNAVNIADEPFSMIENMMPLVSESKKQMVTRLKNRDDALRSLTGDILIRSVICNIFGISNKNICFETNKYGKPAVPGLEHFFFNISHSGDWVVCAWGDSPVGVDVERIQPTNIDIAKRFFSNIEYLNLLNVDPSQRLAYFFKIWTLKESFIKVIGKGLSIPLNSFSIEIERDGIKLECDNFMETPYFKQYDIGPDYELSVCSLENNFSETVKVSGLDDVCGDLIVDER